MNNCIYGKKEGGGGIKERMCVWGGYMKEEW